MENVRLDFAVVHRWIADHFFGGEAWVYNGAATEVRTTSGHLGQVYVCRARDMREGQHSLSHVAMQIFDAQWRPTTTPRLLPIITADADAAGMDTGPQDARVFVFAGDLWVVFNMLCADGYRRMHIYNATGQGNAIALKIDGQDRSRTEKNWTPFVHQSELFFIYYFAPLVLLKCDVGTGVCKVIFADQSCPRPHIRGGSPALKHPTKAHTYTGWAHTTVSLTPSTRKLYDPDELPTPARKTAHVYRACRFELSFGDPNNPPRVSVDKEREWAGKQIEQIYGFAADERWAILNVNDSQTVLLD